ncbi:MAG: phosphoribosylformylglycinamidine synthase subunit PurQ [Candidatus Pacebacteria bacterium]|nr:phosphoribosylformylglycinamidine synthase subunit PurQ [Candidatus Paceibacterota bacterium]
MKIAIIVFPGTNRENDIRAALVTAGVAASNLQLIWHRETAIPAATDLIVLPGGFSYGDYLRCGAMAAHSPIMREVKSAAARGVAVLGICNGFQILCESGLLPGVLLSNQGLKFVCREVELEVATNQSIYSRKMVKGHRLRAPVAHHDGNYFAAPEVLAELQDRDQIVFKYAADDNPNGSALNIAGIIDSSRRVLGLMPHLENATDPLAGGIAGRAMFDSILNG